MSCVVECHSGLALGPDSLFTPAPLLPPQHNEHTCTHAPTNTTNTYAQTHTRTFLHMPHHHPARTQPDCICNNKPIVVECTPALTLTGLVEVVTDMCVFQGFAS